MGASSDSDGRSKRSWKNRRVLLVTGLVLILLAAFFGFRRYHYTVSMQELQKAAHLLSVYVNFDMQEEKLGLFHDDLTEAERSDLASALKRISDLSPESGKLAKDSGVFLYSGKVRTTLLRSESKPILMYFRNDGGWKLDRVVVDPDEALLGRLAPPAWYVKTQKWMHGIDAIVSPGESSRRNWYLVIAGVLLLCAGKWLFKELIIIPGAVAGMFIGIFLGSGIGTHGSLIGGLLGALLGGGLASALADLFLLLLGFSLSCAGVAGLWVVMMGQLPPGIVVLIGGILGTGLIISLYWLVIVILTSLLGAYLLYSGLAIGGSSWLFWLAVVFGMGVQYGVIAIDRHTARRRGPGGDHHLFRRKKI